MGNCSPTHFLHKAALNQRRPVVGTTLLGPRLARLIGRSGRIVPGELLRIQKSLKPVPISAIIYHLGQKRAQFEPIAYLLNGRGLCFYLLF
jgi:hypothetical protein